MHDGDADDDGDRESASEQSDDETHVVTAFLRNRGEVLLLRRSDAVGTYTGRWGGVSGYAEGNPDEQVRVEIREETGLEVDVEGAGTDEESGAVAFVRAGRPVRVEDSDPDSDLERTWLVHPYLFDCEDREVTLSEEHTASEWVSPPTMLGVGPDSEPDRETVPGLWAAYERVAPTVRSVAADDEHGAATLSVRALEVLRDRAGVLASERDRAGGDGELADEDEDVDEDESEEWDELALLARRLLEVRPSMAVLRNRVNRAMAGADGRDAPAVLASATEGIDRALEADTAAAANAGEYATGTVLTLSRSGTVLEAFRASDSLDRVFVAESRPTCEGRDVAEWLADDDLPVTLHTDAAVAHVLACEDIDCVLVGADTVLPDGRVINKTGTRGVAIAAAHEDVPVYVVAADDKVSPHGNVTLESGTGSAVYDGDAPIDVANPTFDVTPVECVDGVLTEDGLSSTDEIEDVAEALGALEDWREE
ncbi:initiation factor 2B [Halobacteria archaeon AArc-m2/3/4]|uniref:Initiation factor 2B n=1 Tax=Natronoglomus mannanivorans TaxID=2979990 RepID=A0ABT2QHK8_9EURY|nr:initiation factor 2B [Halobacteria archaeon AArc-m2/3/4]